MIRSLALLAAVLVLLDTALTLPEPFPTLALLVAVATVGAVAWALAGLIFPRRDR
ncbi:hypothetical protein [Actinomadura macrotermitis]|uniref:Uncharacterized protein n=1 Tax=Actinomadura macrotermitis TaxID=2585200 RepID=A0A7K0BSM3_9ACTN|nr:hypothetical protein [Actinomadura macrotermitis]MQY04147.1 hypothetical protein [Actinomadura macrotermitis]